ncbi:Homeodomain-like DNA binding domain-containing transcription factor [Phycomyces blakesleeanus NRRL 1555(-)]|uniref:Homeodomain-like DNA binding domain-containing transcription factor n=1 Tax=Phycomyces blakesleeanus (strain ATCC 8743b / DSM 1359 / FGSC 10004 / NBRC 33097 / NRRL 1555) TaxID=763407 RepID=A0A162WBU8_PHYB8|nr:Homeodomain-like DNA binding domain-containing transcription factor [Phycomyces blakesleeanus NRRL 1555(-)]OAD66165.1 Homeodomain-like DNA binding domain-containing transcription factor [Phycomyces blakesleeanus NRRL 1555(-)]|eukprot:XP_018284205.1 Homeodomain-like DNA binding domain-containing transcription factor [Phycomyces blakesleeanus NRRL 1555(-)]
MLNVSPYTISRMLKYYKETGWYERVKNPGRPKKLNARDKREILHEISKDPMQPMSYIRKAIANLISANTLRYFLRSNGIYSFLHKNNTGLHTTFISPTMKCEGGSFMVGGCFFSKGVGALKIINGQANGKKHVEVLEKAYLPSLSAFQQQTGWDDLVLQEDNAKAHTSNVVVN